MKLYVLRHGDAVEHGDPRYKENERPLTPKGIQRTKQLAHTLREMEVSIGVILSSPLTRARQTAEIVARSLKLEQKLEFTDHLSLPGSMQKLVEAINAIRPAPGSVMLVGQERYLGGFISLLCIGGPNLPLKLKKGALCRLEAGRVTCGQCAVLEWLVPPRVIASKPAKREEE